MKFFNALAKAGSPRQYRRKTREAEKRRLYRTIGTFLPARGNFAVYDIGAHVGRWSTDFSAHFRNADCIMFEANVEHEAALFATGLPYSVGPLAAEEGEVLFYSKAGTGDSLYRENTTSYDGIAPSTLSADTLDNVVARRGFAPPNMIKLDTQGSELDILKGGVEALSHACLAYMESPILPYNQGAPSVSDYAEFMLSQGFLPHDVFEVHCRKEVVTQVDILFVRAPLLFETYPGRADYFAPLMRSRGGLEP